MCSSLFFHWFDLLLVWLLFFDLANIFCLCLSRWKLKVQQNLLRVITIKQAQSSAKTGEERTKAAFTCETLLLSIFRQVVLMYRYSEPPPIPLLKQCYKQCGAISHTQHKLLKYQLVQILRAEAGKGKRVIVQNGIVRMCLWRTTILSLKHEWRPVFCVSMTDNGLQWCVAGSCVD